jgi:hypothetical protein
MKKGEKNGKTRTGLAIMAALATVRLENGKGERP